MPDRLAPLSHLIGANMSVRRNIFEEIGGFHSIDFDDLDLCMRVAARCPGQRLMYEPRAIVYHYVPLCVSWRYFWRRCFYVNFEKAEAFAQMGAAANIKAEREFVFRAVTKQVSLDLGDVLRGKYMGILRISAMLVGVAMAGAGHSVGRFRIWFHRKPFVH